MREIWTNSKKQNRLGESGPTKEVIGKLLKVDRKKAVKEIQPVSSIFYRTFNLKIPRCSDYNPFITIKMKLCLYALILLIGSGNPVFGQRTIRGTVTDAKTGQPLPGVAISVIGTTMGALTDAEGKFFILNLPPGWYQIQAQIIEYKPSDKFQVKGSPGRTKTKNIKL